MTTQPTPKRWRPRFSVRTLVILVTLVCCYAACWGPTRTQGVTDVRTHIYGPPFPPDVHTNIDGFPLPSPLYFNRPYGTGTPHVPLVIGWEERGRATRSWGSKGHRQYYFWFFGYVVKLPYERDL